MRAVIFDEYGDRSVLKVRNLAERTPGPVRRAARFLRSIRCG
jgi:hypothetical protein